jgi:hypothetical protein
MSAKGSQFTERTMRAIREEARDEARAALYESSTEMERQPMSEHPTRPELEMEIMRHAQECAKPDGPLGILSREVSGLVKQVEHMCGAAKTNRVWTAAIVSIATAALGVLLSHYLGKVRDVQSELIRAQAELSRQVAAALHGKAVP